MEPGGICRGFDKDGDFVLKPTGQNVRAFTEPERRSSFGEHSIQAECFPPRNPAQDDRPDAPALPMPAIVR